ncbi:Glypican-5 [Eumeta japonica]|uniref:Glypican-5 n=1 Tax=Eumeta variegata TaxID=151549 RepID=A0A4C1VM64_EUMVA|nr:Glypican-5 [Eumeta japonica]
MHENDVSARKQKAPLRRGGARVARSGPESRWSSLRNESRVRVTALQLFPRLSRYTHTFFFHGRFTLRDCGTDSRRAKTDGFEVARTTAGERARSRGKISIETDRWIFLQILTDKSIAVRQECGAHSVVDGGAGGAAPAPQGGGRRGLFRAPPPDTELLQFAAQLAANKRLFAGLSDRLCDEPELAHADNARCWTGEGVGEYTKPLVTSNSLSDQRYNPEVSDVTPLPRVAALADQLRHARQVLVSHKWSSSPTAEAFMQGDEAEVEHDMGSGSGRSLDDSPDYDADGSGDGSGHGPDITLNKGAIEEVATQKPSAAVSFEPSTSFAFVSMIFIFHLT